MKRFAPSSLTALVGCLPLFACGGEEATDPALGGDETTGPAGPQFRAAYVANADANSVSVIATASNTVVATVPVGPRSVGVAITPDGAFAYVTNSNSNSVSVLATASNTVVATVPVGASPFGVAITPFP